MTHVGKVIKVNLYYDMLIQHNIQWVFEVSVLNRLYNTNSHYDNKNND